MTEEEQEQQQMQLPEVDDVLLSTAVSLVNMAGIRLTDQEHRNPTKAKEAIDAARALLPLCPEEAVGPIKDALSQVQMLYVKETQNPAHPAEPGASGQQGAPAAPGPVPAPAEPAPDEEEERAKARSKIWTPPGS